MEPTHLTEVPDVTLEDNWTSSCGPSLPLENVHLIMEAGDPDGLKLGVYEKLQPLDDLRLGVCKILQPVTCEKLDSFTGPSFDAMFNQELDANVVWSKDGEVFFDAESQHCI